MSGERLVSATNVQVNGSSRNDERKRTMVRNVGIGFLGASSVAIPIIACKQEGIKNIKITKGAMAKYGIFAAALTATAGFIISKFD